MGNGRLSLLLLLLLLWVFSRFLGFLLLSIVRMNLATGKAKHEEERGGLFTAMGNGGWIGRMRLTTVSERPDLRCVVHDRFSHFGRRRRNGVGQRRTLSWDGGNGFGPRKRRFDGTSHATVGKVLGRFEKEGTEHDKWSIVGTCHLSAAAVLVTFSKLAMWYMPFSRLQRGWGSDGESVPAHSWGMRGFS